MKPLIYSKKSLDDIEGILEYISRDKPEAAIRFAEQILAQCELLAQAPELGELRPSLLPLLRVFCFRNYGIYYRFLEDHLRVERILHGALNASRQDFLE